MKTALTHSSRNRQCGYVSVLAVLALASVVLVVLSQSVRIFGSKALESQQYQDNVAAFAVAESGTEIAKALIAANYDTSGSLSSCGNLATPASNTVGSGSFSFVSAVLDTSGTYCKFRVKGTVNNANRTIETWMGFTNEIGTSGYGSTPKLVLNNTYPVPATALFDLAWRVKGSDGHPETTTTNVYCTTCGVNQLWVDELPGTGNALGGVGNTQSANPSSSAQYTQTLGNNRNYIMVGLLMGGKPIPPSTLTLAPSAVGGFQFSNSSNQPSSLSLAATASAGTGCSDDNANALVLGISGRGAGIDPVTGIADVTAGFDKADLNGVITPNMWTKYVHYPNIDGSTPNAVGDVFAEIFYYYKEPVFVTGASGNKNQTDITISGITNSLQVNDYIRSGTDLPEKTYITAITTDTNKNTTTFTINNKITNKLTNATLCSGICGIVPRTANQATLTLSRNTSTLSKGWVAGIACMKGVNNAYVKVVNSSRPRVIQWHEVISGE